MKVLASEWVDLILTDVDMPVMDGRTRPHVKENNIQTYGHSYDRLECDEIDKRLCDEGISQCIERTSLYILYS